MEAERKPLNGQKTHPLKEPSLRWLRDLADTGEAAAYLLNPGTRDRLAREELIYTAVRRLTMPNGKKKTVEVVGITDAGRAVVAKEKGGAK